MNAWEHIPVLLEQATDALVTDPGGCYVDGTFGRGGHAQRILRALDAHGRLIAFDRDPAAQAAAAHILDARFELRHSNFSALAQLPAGSVCGLLLDLGVSSPQLDDGRRGFSFRADGPLDMRMDPTRGQTAAQWLAQAPQAQIAEVIRDYGEERFARAIAKAVVARREAVGPLATTGELAQLVAGVVKTREAGKHPATRTFQAVRIFINGELDELARTLEASLTVLRTGGRLVVISFHSLEDRMVKRFVRAHAGGVVDRRLPPAAEAPARLRRLARVRPDADEQARNPRARSAIMRVAERTAAALPPAAGTTAARRGGRA